MSSLSITTGFWRIVLCYAYYFAMDGHGLHQLQDAYDTLSAETTETLLCFAGKLSPATWVYAACWL